jgi:hypothetical protein
MPLTFGPESRNVIRTENGVRDLQPLNLAGALGAAASASIECLTFYIPSRDKEGNTVDQKPWIAEALALLSQIGGGAIALPPAEGAWLNPDTGALIKEAVVLAYTYVDPYRFGAPLGKIREFTHRVGRETRQEEVVLEFSGRLYKIMHFDLV